MSAKDGVILPSQRGYSWCCRLPVIKVGQHWECSNCGKPNATNTYHEPCPVDVKTTPMSKEGKYVGDMLKEAA